MRKLKATGATSASEAPLEWDEGQRIRADPSAGAVVVRGELPESRSGGAGSVVNARFGTANPSVAKPMSPPLARMVETRFATDSQIAGEIEELDRELATADCLGNHASALDSAEHRARRAFRVYLQVQEMREEWELENKVIFGSMRAEAMRTLQREKDSGARSKAITNDDIEAEMARIYPDQWIAQEKQRAKARRVEEDARHRAEMWSSKCRSLGVLVTKGR